MPRRKNPLNVKQHLEHLRLIFDGLEKYGMCPGIEDEIRKARFINNQILKKHEEKTTRKDIYIHRS